MFKRNQLLRYLLTVTIIGICVIMHTGCLGDGTLSGIGSESAIADDKEKMLTDNNEDIIADENEPGTEPGIEAEPEPEDGKKTTENADDNSASALDTSSLPPSKPLSSQKNPSTDWPGSSNTGVPAGKKLTVHEGDLKITKDNTVIDSMEIRGLVRIEAKNVTIKNCLITGRYLSSSLSLIYVNGPNYSVTVQDSELYAKYPSPYIRGVIGYNFTLERVNIHHVIDQVCIIGDNVTVKDSWLHDSLYYLKDPTYNNTPTHDDNFQIQIGRNIRIIHNTMTSTHNAAIMVTQDSGVVADVLIERNFVSDGASGFNLAQKAYGPLKGFTIKNNVFTRTQVYRGLAIIVDAPSKSLLSLSGNVWDDGTPISITTR